MVFVGTGAVVRLNAMKIANRSAPVVISATTILVSVWIFNLFYHEPQQDYAADDDAEDGCKGDILLP